MKVLFPSHLLILGLYAFAGVRGLAQHPMLPAAWDAFSAQNPRYPEAIRLADRCIDDLAITANKMEQDLESQRAPKTKGSVSAEQKNEILSRGPLNDVAACYFIKGRSSQSLGRNREALAAYAAGCKLQYALVWDPKGWFWPPAEELCERQKALTTQGSQPSKHSKK